MSRVFDFSDIQKSESKITATWNDFRNDLKNNKYKYNDLEAAKESVFLKVFDDLFMHCSLFLEKDAHDILSDDVQITRASHLDKDEPSPTYDRIMPIAKHITKHNRFSPPGVEWLYLAFGNGNYGEYTISEMCALRECRAKVDDRMAICNFKLKKEYYSNKIIDLTIAKSLSFDDLNNDLETIGKQIRDREYNNGIYNYLKNGALKKSQIDVSDIYLPLKKWVIYTYAKLLSEQIFLPIESENREIMYAPFQCLAQYFISKGYSGIVYSSTVFPEGKNIVLFDKNSANPIGIVKDIVFKE